MGIRSAGTVWLRQVIATSCPVVITLLVTGNALAESDLNSGSLVSAKLTPAALEMDEATIGRIIIDNRNIFDPEIPAEDRWLYRMANALHVRTRPQVIESQLLFAEGDEYSCLLYTSPSPRDA